MTVELLKTIFTGTEINQIAGTYEARYKGHVILDTDLVRLAQRLWQSNA